VSPAACVKPYSRGIRKRALRTGGRTHARTAFAALRQPRLVDQASAAWLTSETKSLVALLTDQDA
jgi:hypothetical protein